MTDFLSQDWWKTATLQDVKAKIAAECEINARNEAGLSPLIMAASFTADPKIIAELIKAGADLNAKDWLVGSVLANAAKNNSNPEIIKTLLECGAAVNEEDINDEMTPLMFAAKYNPNPEVIKTLIEAGADVLARDTYNNTAADYFERTEEYPEIKEILSAKENKDFTEKQILEKDTNIVLNGKDKEYFSRFLSEYLTPREERLLRMHFGIGTDRQYTFNEIGNKFKVTGERVIQIVAKAFRKLQQPEIWKKIEFLPYWGTSKEEEFLRWMHLNLFNKSRHVEQFLKTGFSFLDTEFGRLRENYLLMIQGECVQTEQFTVSLMQSILNSNDGYILLFNTMDFRNLTLTVFDDFPADDDISLVGSRLSKDRILKRNLTVMKPKLFSNSLSCWLKNKKYEHLQNKRLLAIFASLPKYLATNEQDFVIKLKELAKTIDVPIVYLQEYNIIDYDYADVIVKLDAVNNYQEPIEISISKQQPVKQIIRANEGNLKYCKKLKDCKGLWFYEEKNEE